MNSMVHVAGQSVTVNNRLVRQRCAWCGALLLDYDMMAMGIAYNNGMPAASPATWTPGNLVEQFDNGTGVFFHGSWVPENGCSQLDPAVTR